MKRAERTSLRDGAAPPDEAAIEAHLYTGAAPPRAVSSVRAYAHDWADFAAWCAAARRTALPATPETVQRYLVALQLDGRAVATLQRRLAAIAARHQEADLPSPTAHRLVRHQLQQIRREEGVGQVGKDPILGDELRAMVAELPVDPRGLRDRALLLLGFAAALRRSELVALAVRDLRFDARGVVLTIRQSKTDQEGRGATVAVARRKDAAGCPVRATRRWLDAGGVRDGHVFRPIHARGQVQPGPLNAEHVARLVKRVVAAARDRALAAGDDDLAARLDPARFAGHSLRAGFVTTAALQEVPEGEIAETTRHKSREMIDRYTRIADPFRRGAAAKREV